MDVTPAHIAAAKKLIRGGISFRGVKRKYSNREAAVTAAVLLHASGITEFGQACAWGYLGNLLCDLSGSDPTNRLGDPSRRDHLMGTAYRLGLYERLDANGNRTRLILNPLIDEFLHDDKLRQAAVQLAAPIIEARRKTIDDEAVEKSLDARVRWQRSQIKRRWGIDLGNLSAKQIRGMASDMQKLVEALNAVD